MAYPTDIAGAQIAETHTSPQFTVGQRMRGSDGAEWQYVQATSAITAKYWVAIDSTFAAAASSG